MRLLARQILRLVLVAVALGAGSLNGYLGVLSAFEAHAHGPSGVHAHAGDHVHMDGAGGHHVHDHDAHDHAALDTTGDDAGACEHACEHRHVHCCSTIAVPAAECGVKLALHACATVRLAKSLLPHGQIASPLFRPPRTAA